MTHEEGVMPDVEFVTKVKNNICLKSFLAGVKFQALTHKITLSGKFADFGLEFSQKNWSE